MKRLIKVFCLLIFIFINKLSVAQQQYEIIARISPPDSDMSGIAVSSDNRVFLGFPRHADNHTSYALAELVKGKPVPFPNKDYVYPSVRRQNLVSF